MSDGLALRRQQHEDGGGRRQYREHQRRDPSVGAGSVHLALQLEPLTDDVSQTGEDLTQVAAGLFLQDHRGHEETHIQQWDPLGQVVKRRIQRGPEILLIEQGAELQPQRVGQVIARHAEAYRKSVSGAHGARQKVESLGKLLFEGGGSARAFTAKIEIGQRSEKSGKRGGRSRVSENRRQHPGKGQRSYGHAGHRQDQSARRPIHSGLLDQLLCLLQQCKVLQPNLQLRALAREIS